MPYIGTKPENIIATAVDTTTGKFSGEVDAASLDISGDVDVDGILEADAITLNGTAIGSIYSPIAGSSSVVTTGALNSGSITSGFGAIDTGSSNITSTGVGSFGSLDISGDIDVDGVTNLDVVDIDGAVDMASTLAVAGVASFADGTVSAPALTFNSDTNMGLYRGGTDILKFVTAGTDAITIDASQNVTMAGTLDVVGGLVVDGNDSYTSNIKFDYGSSAPTYFANWGYKSSSDGNKVFLTITDNGTAKDVLVANYNGNVGIGISSPARQLVLYGSAPYMAFQNATTGATSGDGLQIQQVGSDAYIWNYENSFISLGTNSSERMRIDSSGTVFVAKTAENVAVVGHELRSSGFLASTRDGATVSALTRLSSDGTILEFRKDSSSIGIIGTQGGRLSIGSGDVNLNFNASANAMYPISDPTAGTLSDGAVDIGAALARFKDLYLSGGAYLGGTGTANKLDDYEEGSHTITFTDISINPSSQSSTYTKIGNVVNYIGTLQFPNTSDATEIRISLPFVSTARNGIGVFLSNGVTNKILFTGGTNLSYMRVYPDNTFGVNTYNQLSTLTIYFTITYQTTA
jgi:hypothetical protein